MLTKRTGGFLRGKNDRDAERFQNIRAARLGRHGAIAMFGHGDPRRRAKQGDSCGYIEGVEPVSPRPADVQNHA